MLGNAAQRPQAGTFQRLFLVPAGIVQSSQLIEGKHDICPDLMLHLH